MRVELGVSLRSGDLQILREHLCGDRMIVAPIGDEGFDRLLPLLWPRMERLIERSNILHPPLLSEESKRIGDDARVA